MKVHSLVKLVGALLMLSSQAAYAQIEPYLQAVTPTSIWISWKTSSGTETIAEYGFAPGALEQTAQGGVQIMSDVGYPNNYYYHSVQLTGLQPNTKYYYRVSTGALASQVYSFRTLPEPGQAAAADGHIRFLILGDNQIKSQPRFDSLVVYAKRKCTERYGPDFNEQVSMILMVGDQVDVGTLDHYEHVHFAKCRYLSPLLPISTIIGNHETYGTLQLGAYYDHFFYDSLHYAGIYSGTETYYAFQVGKVLILNLSTEHVTGAVGAAQLNWLQQVVNHANNDSTVDWIMSFGHRPYQAEQYVGDISPWIRNTVMPFLSSSPKFFMHVGAHHHLYARGQLKDTPNYHLISGGTAWDQYWGMSNEVDFDDVQKTLSNWAYQLVDFDLAQQRVDVQTYSIGSIYGWHDNRLIDEFHRVKGQPGPAQPSLETVVPDTLELPFALLSSDFQSPVGELLNSTQFQFSLTPDFSTIGLDKLRDYENFFGPAGSPDSTADLNRGVNILEYLIPAGALPNGKHYLRVRHRDRNLEWSPWSAADSFVVINSTLRDPKIALGQHAYPAGAAIQVTYENGPGNPLDWIGVYKKGEVPGEIASTAWSYVSGASGVLSFNLSQKGEYFAAFFENDGYTEIASRVPFYYGPIPVIASNKTKYELGETVAISYSFAPALEKDWIGIYKIGIEPGGTASAQWQYTAGPAGQLSFSGLDKGYYYASYFLNDGYFEPAGRIFFAVGDTIANLVIDKGIYNLGEYIIATWTDGPGVPKDWLGIYQSWKDPNVDALDTYTYIEGRPAGSLTLSDTLVPQTPGNYYIVLFTNDSYDEISNRRYFAIREGSVGTDNLADNEGVRLYPNPSNGEHTIVESPYPIEKIEVLTLEGRLIYRSENNAREMKVALLHQQLPPGTYMVKVYSRKLYTLQLIIQ